MEKISVIIVTFNAAATLEAAIRSVTAQKYPNTELIIIDGKSKDATVSIIEQHKEHIQYWVSEPDAGIYDAMNKGIAAASGEWVYFLGSDDILADDLVLQKIASEAATGNPAIIYGDVRMKSSGAVYGGSRTYSELIGKNINHQSIFYKRSVLQQFGGYNLNYKVLADYDLNLRIFRDADIGKKYVPLQVALFNDRGGASNITIDYPFFSEKLNFFRTTEKYKATDPLLQQYQFYTGFVQLWRDKKFKGLKGCCTAFIFGPRKIFYILVFIKFTLGYFGIGKKIKIV